MGGHLRLSWRPLLSPCIPPPGRDHLLKGCGLERALPLKLRIATKPSAALMRIYLEATSDWSKLNSAGQEEVLLSGR